MEGNHCLGGNGYIERYPKKTFRAWLFVLDSKPISLPLVSIQSALSPMRATKILFCILFLSCVGITAQAQSWWTHSIGAGVGYYKYDRYNLNYSLHYNPRWNFKRLGPKSSLSLSGVLGMGWEKVFFNNRSFYLSVGEFAVLTEYCFGHYSHPNASRNFGGFIGLGWGFTQFPVNYKGLGEDAPTHSLTGLAGIAISTGFRCLLDSRSYGLRISYYSDYDFKNYGLATASIYFNFGRFKKQ